jgi:hypothetical protein
MCILMKNYSKKYVYFRQKNYVKKQKIGDFL